MKFTGLFHPILGWWKFIKFFCIFLQLEQIWKVCGMLNLWNPGRDLKRTWLLVSFFGGWIGVGVTSLVRTGDGRIQLFTTMLFVISEIWYRSSKYRRFSHEDHHPWDAELNMFSILVLVIFTGYHKTAKWSIKVASFVQQKHSIVPTQPRNPKRDKKSFFWGGC